MLIKLKECSSKELEEVVKMCKTMNDTEGLTYIVCQRELVSPIQSKARELEINIPFSVSYQECINSNWNGTFIKHFIIVDYDYFLNNFLLPSTNIGRFLK